MLYLLYILRVELVLDIAETKLVYTKKSPQKLPKTEYTRAVQ